MPHITISYRRADSDAMSGRIRDKLASYYGDAAIFMDIDSIPVGIDFREQIRNELAKNDLLIVVVGPKWRGPSKGGRARINDENDPVRVEVEAALQRGIPVVPVLVNGARIPRPDELPDSLRNFSFHNGAIVDSGQDFHLHMERLLRSLDRVLGIPSKLEEGPSAGSTKMRPAMKWAAVGVGICTAAVAGAAGTWFFETQTRGAAVRPAAPPALSGAITPAASGPQSSAGNVTPPPRPPPPSDANTSSAATAVQQAPAVQSPAAPHKTPDAEIAPPAQPPAATNPQLAALPAARKSLPAPPAETSCKGSAAFEDDFTAPEVGWNRQLGARNTGSNAFFADHNLVMKPAAKLSRIIVYPSLVFKAAAICGIIQTPADLKVPGDTSAGLAFWASDDRNLYSFEIIPDGAYAIRRLIDNTWSFITNKLKSDAVRQGPGEINQLEVRVKQNTAELWLNGVKLQDFKGQPPTRMSSIGFVVRNESENEYEWKFHNIGVFEAK